MTSQQNNRRPARRRRGVLLLIVLSILVMFMAVGTVFVLNAGFYKSGAKAQAKSNVASPQQADLLDRAVRQVLRDTQNRNSAIRYHSLLRDVYGTDGFVANVLYAPGQLAPQFSSLAAGQLVDIIVRDIVPAAGFAGVLTNDHVLSLETSDKGLPVDATLPRVDGYFNGCLLTMLGGPAKGQSTRILEYDYLGDEPSGSPLQSAVGSLPAPSSGVAQYFRLRVMAFPNASGGLLKLPTDFTVGPNDLAGHAFMVNGRPFNGAGVGLNLLSDPTGARLTAYEGVFRDGGNAYDASGNVLGGPVALLPNSRFFLKDYQTNAAGTTQYNLFQADGAGVYRGFLTQDGAATGAPLYNDFTGPGGPDESYDAPDFQNMFLGSTPLRPRSRGRVVLGANTLEVAAYYTGSDVPAPDRLDLESLPIPSFHRPALVNYWLHKLYGAPWLSGLSPNQRVRAIIKPYNDDTTPYGDPVIAAQIAAFKRKYILRPLTEDHPKFNGSNPLAVIPDAQLDAITSFVNGSGVITFPSPEVAGPWDVDNDGDGVPDSVWVDLGMPVQQTEDGRAYKPLFAILVQDLDGRLNLNAHGSQDDLVVPASLATSANSQHDFSNSGGAPLRANLAGAVGGPAPSTSFVKSSDQLPHGSGWGPADVSLRPVLTPELLVINPFEVSNPQFDDYARLLLGRPAATGQRVTWGRYGAGANTAMRVAPGVPFNLANPSLATLDPLATLEKQDYPAFAPSIGLRLANDPSFGLVFQSMGAGSRSGFGAMPDLKSKFSVGVDFGGQPINEPEYEASPFGSPSNATLLTADSPYELELMDHNRRDHVADILAVGAAYASGTPINDDAPFSPGELERILRVYDADAARLPDRLWNLVDAFDPTKLLTAANATGVGPSTPVDAAFEAATRARAVTTESFDIPSTNEEWTARLMVGADGLPGIAGVDDDGNGVIDDITEIGFANTDDYFAVMGELPPTPGRLIDYLRYRVALELLKHGSTPTDALINVIVHGSLDSATWPSAQYGGLLAPEILSGLKMDLNRPFGDGRDMNANGVGNGIVDEPNEAGEPFFDANANFTIDAGEYIDLNGNGVFDPVLANDFVASNLSGGAVPFAHTAGQDPNPRMARQLYARHLYCLALLLMDENYLIPYDKRDAQVVEYLDPDAGLSTSAQREPSVAWKIAQTLAGDAGLTGTPAATPVQKQEARRRAWRKLTLRRIAQWAINCVDMRDPDAISTPFEYDENPWDGWNVTDTVTGTGLVTPLDGEVRTDENLGNFSRLTPTGAVQSVVNDTPAAYIDQTRGVVWGMERPELLVTETFATHDTRTEDLEGFYNPATGSNSELNTLYDPNDPTKDPDLDQRLKPLGTLFVEVYNPNSQDGQAPADLYRGRDLDDADGDNNLYTGADTKAGVTLDLLTPPAGGALPSPVWRMIVVQEPPLLRNRTPSVVMAEESEFETDLPGALGQLVNGGGAPSIGAGTLRPMTWDPGFPTFDPDRLPQYTTVSGVQSLSILKSGAYVERSVYFNANGPGRDPDSIESQVRIPMRFTAGSIPSLPAPTAPKTKSIDPGLLGAEGNRMVGSELQVFDYHFPPAEVTPGSLAPILPGRYGVIGTAGYQYSSSWSGNAPSPAYPGRFIVPFGRTNDAIRQAPPNPVNRPPGYSRDEAHFKNRLLLTRRFDFVPSMNPEVHQFAVMNNGGPESRLIMAGAATAFNRNVTNPVVGGGSGNHVGDLVAAADVAGRLAPDHPERRIQPIVAVPIQGLAVSTPLDGYLRRMIEVDKSAPGKWSPYAAYGEGAFYATAQVGPLDTPLDDPATHPHLTRLQSDTDPNKAVTTVNFRSVHLQRLADPTLPWNPANVAHPQYNAALPVNPYITVDSSSVDLTPFNGTELSPFVKGQLNQMTMASQQRGAYAASTPNQNLTQNPPPGAGRAAWAAEPPTIDDERVAASVTRVTAGGVGSFFTPPLTQAQAATVPVQNTAFASAMNLDAAIKPAEAMAADFVIRHSLGFANCYFPLTSPPPAGAPVSNYFSSHGGIYSSEMSRDGDQTTPGTYDATPYHTIDVNGDAIPGDLIGAPLPDKNVADTPHDDEAYPWLAWNNRPFASALELLQVPASSSSSLGKEFSVYNPRMTVVPNVYNGSLVDAAGEVASNDARMLFQRGQFGHLLNLFSTSPRPALAVDPNILPGPGGVTPSGAANLSRLTSYVRVPSRFVATQTTLSPTVFNVAATAGADDPRAPLMAPFNKVDQYREPGRVNLNTIAGLCCGAPLGSSPVYDGLMHRRHDTNLIDTSLPNPLVQMGHTGPAWRDFVTSRRGYVEPGGSAQAEMALNPLVPTFFGNPFREPEEGQLVPVASMVHPGAEASLLRSHPFAPGADGAWGIPAGAMADDNLDGVVNDAGEAGLTGDDFPLFDASNGLVSGYSNDATSDFHRVPLFSSHTTETAINGQRNSALRYMPMTRMSSMATTRSGAFAIWITVGFFEVSAAPDWNDPSGATQDRFLNNRQLYDRVYPDGWQLGKELGSDTGDTHRHRGFWIVDRTLPVAFRPGDDVNLEKMILLRREIE